MGNIDTQKNEVEAKENEVESKENKVESKEGKGFIQKIGELFSRDSSEKKSVEKTPDPDMLGDGMANEAAEMALDRKEKMKKIMEELG